MISIPFPYFPRALGFAARVLAFTVAGTVAAQGITTVPGTTFHVREGRSGEYLVHLDTEPAHDVTVAVASSNTGIATITSGASLTFTTFDWETPQIVRVTGVDDADPPYENNTTTITHTASSTDPNYHNLTKSLSVSVDESFAVWLDTDNGDSSVINVTEGGWLSSFLFQLSDSPNPDQDVTLTFTVSDPSALSFATATGTSYTFASADNAWHNKVPGAVAPREDSDSDNEIVTVAISASGGGFSAAAQTVVVVISDAQAGALLVRDKTYETSFEGLRLTEGDSLVYQMRLSAQPASTVTVSSTSTDSSVIGPPADITFTTSNWDTWQDITITGSTDGDSIDEKLELVHTASGPDAYHGKMLTIPILVLDSDRRRVLVSPGNAQGVAEGGSVTFQVSLSHAPVTANVSVVTGDIGVATVDFADTDGDSMLNFDDTNFDTPQTVTITTLDDSIVNAVDRLTAISFTADDSNGDYLQRRLSVIAEDDEDTVTVSTQSVTVAEGAGANTYTIVLDNEPTGDVTITPMSDDTSVATVMPPTLTFTRTNWSTAQTVTVTGVNDLAINSPDRTATISHTAAGGGYDESKGTTIADVTVTATDDDAVVPVRIVTVTESNNGTEVDEDGGMDTYTVVLGGVVPTGDVTITLSGYDTSVVTVDKTTLTFTTANWQAAQTVTVTGADDAIVNSPARTTTISHTATGGGYDGVSINAVAVNSIDDDAVTPTPMVSVSKSGVRVAENAGTDTYSVVLGGVIPSATVTITLSGIDTAVATVDKTMLTFDSTNWQTPQTVTVTGVDDAVVNSPNRTTTISHSASGGGYGSVSVSSVTVTAVDDDAGTGTIVVTETNGSTQVAENGATDTYTVALSGMVPSGTVTVTLSGFDTTVATVSPTSLVFDASNWATGQSITVTGVDDANVNTPNRTTSISHSAAGGGYGGASSVSVTVTAVDNDKATPRTITVTESRGTTEVAENGGWDTYTVVLGGVAPTGTVTIALIGYDSAVATVDPTSLTFDTTNWTAPQEIRVTGVDDTVANAASRYTTIDHVATGGNFDGVTIASVTVTVRDDGRDDPDDGSEDPDDGGDSPGADGGYAAEIPTAGMVPAKADLTRQGFIRLINHEAEAGQVAVDPVDDWGGDYDGVTIELPANSARHFNSDDLEDGNDDKDMSGGVGPGYGDWRLALTSDLDVEWLAYIRTTDGFLTAMHDAVMVDEDSPATLPIFNPGSNENQVSRLRLINPNETAGTVWITGIDDDGNSPGSEATAIVSAGRSITFTAAELENGGVPRLSGVIGDGEGKWRLALRSNLPVVAMSLMFNEGTGHLTNLTSTPTMDAYLVPLFPAAGQDRQGFVRVINRSSVAGTVSIQAVDETIWQYDPLTLTIDAGETIHFNSDDLEDGNASKGLTGSTGPGVGDWWLEFTTPLDLQVLSYIRTKSDGFLTSMHDTAPMTPDDVHRVVTLNPGRNENQVGLVRLLNPGMTDATATIQGTDDGGQSGITDVVVTVPARRAINLTAQELEAGDETAFAGMLGVGEGKWRLAVTADQPIHVMSLINATLTGHLTNLSTTTRVYPAGDESTDQ